MNNPILHKKDVIYYTRIMPTVGIFDVCELIIRTVEDEWFVGIDKHDKHAYLFSYKSIGEYIFFNRSDALKIVKEAEKLKPKITTETYYEEY